MRVNKTELQKLFNDRVAPTVAGLLVAGVLLSSVHEFASSMHGAYKYIFSSNNSQPSP